MRIDYLDVKLNTSIISEETYSIKILFGRRHRNNWKPFISFKSVEKAAGKKVCDIKGEILGNARRNFRWRSLVEFAVETVGDAGADGLAEIVTEAFVHTLAKATDDAVSEYLDDVVED